MHWACRCCLLQVFCIVRGKTDEQALGRIGSNLQHLELCSREEWEQVLRLKVVALRGDLGLRRLGLTPEAFHRLAEVRAWNQSLPGALRRLGMLVCRGVRVALWPGVALLCSWLCRRVCCCCCVTGCLLLSLLLRP